MAKLPSLGLAATGVTAAGLAPRQVQAWLERVRSRELTASESAATLVAVYRLWLLALLLKALGSGWDMAWHFRWLRDDFAPPHDVNLLGDALVIVLVLFHWYTRFGVDAVAFRLMAGGILLFLGSAPIDVVNHRINGLDITAWSITHFGLYTGTAIMVAGAIRGWRIHAGAGALGGGALAGPGAGPGAGPVAIAGAVAGRRVVLGGLWFFFLENVLFPSQHQEYGVAEIASWDRGDPYAEDSLLAFAARQIAHPVDRTALVHFSLPVAPWVYPVWLVGAAMLTLLLARRSVGARWTATVLASLYIGWRCVLWPLFAATGFPTSAVPFLLLGGAIAVDLVCLLGLPWVSEAVLGGVLATAGVYLGGYVQTNLLMAPPIAYRSAPVAFALLVAGWAAASYLRTRRGLTPF